MQVKYFIVDLLLDIFLYRLCAVGLVRRASLMESSRPNFRIANRERGISGNQFFPGFDEPVLGKIQD